jgi:hypothetical protein
MIRSAVPLDGLAEKDAVADADPLMLPERLRVRVAVLVDDREAVTAVEAEAMGDSGGDATAPREIDADALTGTEREGVLVETAVRAADSEAVCDALALVEMDAEAAGDRVRERVTDREGTGGVTVGVGEGTSLKSRLLEQTVPVPPGWQMPFVLCLFSKKGADVLTTPFGSTGNRRKMPAPTHWFPAIMMGSMRKEGYGWSPPSASTSMHVPSSGGPPTPGQVGCAGPLARY